MNELHFPWLTLLALAPFAAAGISLRGRLIASAHSIGTVVAAICIALAAGAWIDLGQGGSASDPLVPSLLTDDLSAPLLLCVALMVRGRAGARRMRRCSSVPKRYCS